MSVPALAEPGGRYPVLRTHTHTHSVTHTHTMVHTHTRASLESESRPWAANGPLAAVGLAWMVGERRLGTSQGLSGSASLGEADSRAVPLGG